MDDITATKWGKKERSLAVLRQLVRPSAPPRRCVGLSGLRERRRRTCLVHILVWRGVGNEKGLKILHVFISVDISHVFASKLLKVERTYCNCTRESVMPFARSVMEMKSFLFFRYGLRTLKGIGRER